MLSSFRPYAYPPEARTSGRDRCGRPLPPLPSKTPKPPQFLYAENKSFALKRLNQVVTVTITKQVDVGYSNFSQAVLANVEDGPPTLMGEEVFLKFYDPLFLNPDDLRSIRVPISEVQSGEGGSEHSLSSIKPRLSSSSSDSATLPSSGQTLSGSVEVSKTDTSESILVGPHPLWKHGVLAKSIGSNVPPGPRVPRVAERRSTFSTRHFQNELRAYRVLQSLQSNYVTKVLGYFDVNFDDRELEEDRNFKVLMLRKLVARPLSCIDPSSFTATERATIRNSVIDIVKSMYQNDIYFPSIELHQFLLMREDNSVRVCSLGVTYNPSENSLSSEEQDSYKMRAILRATYALDDSGWNF